MKREPGFYWVRYADKSENQEPQMGHWDGESTSLGDPPDWHLPMWMERWHEKDIEVLSERLKPPRHPSMIAIWMERPPEMTSSSGGGGAQASITPPAGAKADPRRPRTAR